jgi:phosphatidylinositol-3-phosphatase
MKRRLLALAALVLTAGLTVTVVSSSSASTAKSVKNFKHVFVFMMENTGIEALQKNPKAPWINQAIQTTGVAGNYYGVTHPSQPNYIASTAGTTAGVPDDNDVTVNLPNIGDQLEAKKHTWKGYMQGLSLCNGDKLAHACGNQLYERKHNPFVSFSDVQSNPARMANVVDLSQLDTDLANNTVPDYSWISPDQCNDMHGRGGGGPSDPCDFSNVQLLIQAGDQFLSTWVGKIMASKAWSGDSAIFITWDESDFTGSPDNFGFGDTRGCCDADPGGGHVLTIVINRNSNGPSASFQLYNHYSLLSTIENAWNLGCLANTCDTANVKPMTDLTG